MSQVYAALSTGRIKLHDWANAKPPALEAGDGGVVWI
jgi:hypothetical protein